MAFGRHILVAAAVGVLAMTTGGATCGDSSSTGGAETAPPSPEERVERARGRSCDVDDECPLYLHCRDGTCSDPPAMVGRAGEGTPQVVFRAAEGEGEPIARFHVELAESEAERHRGLMYRPEIASGWGMLFVYRRAAPRTFWMKNTYIPLDMIFIDGDGRIVEIIESAEPQTTRPRHCESPARFVLEVEGGTAARIGLSKGQRMEMENVPERLRPTRE
ncbi:MAG: DUF192 domain-containing protein [Bradymonadaceae bacterium]